MYDFSDVWVCSSYIFKLYDTMFAMCVCVYVCVYVCVCVCVDDKEACRFVFNLYLWPLCQRSMSKCLFLDC